MAQPSLVGTIKLCLRIGGGEERFELPAISEARVKAALVHASRSANATREIESALRLLVALETRLASASAADRLRSWMRDMPQLDDIIRRLGSRKTKALDLTRDFKRREGRTVDDVAAPRYGAAEPAGTVLLHRLVGERSRLRR